MTIEDRNKELIQTRSDFRKILVRFPQIIEGDPSNWWKETARYALGLKKGLNNYPPELQEYVSKYLPDLFHVLKQEAQIREIPQSADPIEFRALRTETGIVNLSRKMAEPFDKETQVVNENITPLKELINKHPQNFRLDERKIKRVNFSVLGVRPDEHSPYGELLIPKDIPIGHKGGGPRSVLDIDADAPASMIKSEFPWNDFDAAGAGEQHDLRKVAEIMGIDPDGLEVFPGLKVDFSEFALGRDTNQNQVYLDRDGLHYSDEAFQAAQTGHIEIVGGYKKNKAIYGKDLFMLDGVMIAKPRGLMRLIKPVSEGKALDFDYVDLNDVMDFGVFYLFLGRKWNSKKDFGLYMQRMYYIGSQMNQVKKNENNIMDVFERVHEQYPWYDMDKRIGNLRELVNYMSGKLIKQVDREFAWTYGIPSGIEVVRRAGDDVPRKISLAGFKESKKMNDRINNWWPGFLNKCRERTNVFNSKPTDPLFRYFIKSEIQDAEALIPDEDME